VTADTDDLAELIEDAADRLRALLLGPLGPEIVASVNAQLEAAGARFYLKHCPLPADDMADADARGRAPSRMAAER
jgi:hypothetical protein